MIDVKYVKLVKYPDPLLRQKALPVAEVNDETRQIVCAMFDLMYKTGGIGLAAPQAGLSARIVVINLTMKAGKDELTFINPEIVARGGGFVSFSEGCLSLPAIHGFVVREREVTVRAQGLDGESFELTCDGMLARCVQHECDHLDGVLFIDRLSPAKKLTIRAQLRRLETPPEEPKT